MIIAISFATAPDLGTLAPGAIAVGNISSGVITLCPATATTTTTLGASQSTITLGDTVTFTATVTAAWGTATGLVTFFDGATPLGSGALSGVSGNDQATFSTSLLSLSASPHSIQAFYQGAANFTSSTSPAVSVTVNPRASTTGVGLNPTSVAVGQASTATMTVTDAGASSPPGTPDAFATTGTPATGRAGFTSTLFADGLVLVAGGADASGNVLQSAEVYSVSGAGFTATGALNTARTGAVAVLLPNGKVLVAGGSSDGTASGALNTAELYDPIAGTFTATSHNMTAARFGATAVLLNSGNVLLAGGENSGGVLNSAELYTPDTEWFTATGNLNTARTGASATLVGTGKVLVAGGSSDGTANGALNAAEVFDPAGNSGAGTFTSVGGTNPTLSAGRWQPEAALLLSGKVLVAGGLNADGALSSADLYDPVADSFTASNSSMTQARAGGSAVALESGTVLLAGGTSSQVVDLYDLDSDKFDATGSLQQSDNGLAATPLNDGGVLVVGLTTAATPASDAELYSPTFNPLGTVVVTSSEVTDSITGTCALTPSTSTASTCTSTVTPVNVASNPHTITGAYPPDGVHSGSTNGANFTVHPAATTTAVSASPNPSAFGQSVTFTAKVTDSSSGSTAAPTGSVQFAVEGVKLGSPVALTGASSNSSTASIVTATLSVGAPYTVTATYTNTDGNFTGGGSLPGGQTVSPATTTTVVTSSQNPSNFGQSVTFTATVTDSSSGSTEAPTGSVQFVVDSVNFGSPVALTAATSTSSTASIATSTLSEAGSPHSVTANYTNLDGNFSNSYGSLSGGQVVNKANTTTALTSSPNPSALNQSVTFTATVSAVAPGVGTPTGTVTFLDNSSSIGTGTLSGGVATLNISTLAAGSHTITTSYPGDGSFNGSTGSLTGNPQVVVSPPTINKGFGATSIPLNGNTSLKFAVANPNNSVPLTGVGFIDTLPAGLVVSSPDNGMSGSCLGTIMAIPGSSQISLSGASFLAPGLCTFSFNVTGTTAGTKNNTTTAVTSNEGGTGSTASASLAVVAPPSIAKAFSPSTIPLGGTSTLTLTITNPAANTVPLAGVAFTDSLPAGLVVATPNGLTNSCGGTPAAVAGSGALSLTAGSVGVNGSCTVAVKVTGTTAGTLANTTGAVSSTNGGTGNTASANLTVVIPPSISKAFGAPSIPLNGTTSLTFPIANPNSAMAQTGVSFTDSLPAGLVVAPTPGLTNSCGGTATATAGAGAVSLTGGTLAASGGCAVSVNVQGAGAGVKKNSVQAASNEGGAGNVSSANLTVVGPPAISKAFGAPSIPLNTSTSLSFTLQNNNTTVALTGVGFTDTLPAGLVISTPNGLSSSCPGAITATAGTSAIVLSGSSLAASSSCSFSVNVTGTAAGTESNTTSAVTSNEGGTGSTASAILEVVAPPAMSDAFTPGTITVESTSSLGYTLTNPAGNTVAVTGIGFTDTLPAGLTVTSGSGPMCGGTLTTTAPASIAFSGGTVPTGGQCAFSVKVKGAQAGQYSNMVGNMKCTNGGPPKCACCKLVVNGVSVSPPSGDFGNVDAPTRVSETITLKNPGTAAAPLAIAIAPGSGPDANNFDMQNGCPSTLQPGKSCTVVVTFFAPPPYTSSQLGESTATLDVTSGVNTQQIGLEANVINVHPGFEPPALFFGPQAVGVPATQSLGLTTIGLTPLAIGGFSFSGPNAGDFSQTNNCGSTLDGGNWCRVEVTFKPSATGYRTAELILTSNAGTTSVPLSGIGQ